MLSCTMRTVLKAEIMRHILWCEIIHGVVFILYYQNMWTGVAELMDFGSCIHVLTQAVSKSGSVSILCCV